MKLDGFTRRFDTMNPWTKTVVSLHETHELPERLCDIRKRIAMHPKTLHWLRVARTWLVTAGAVFYLYHVSAMPLVLVALLWSAICAAGMRNGIRRAPPERWTRKVPRFESLMTYTLLCGTILLPAIVALLWSGLLVAACAAWIILALSSLMHTILGRFVGELRPPTQLVFRSESDRPH